jgi:DNA-binding HxlR family transcriptional regulator
VPGEAENDIGPRARALRAWTPLARALATTGDHWTLTIVLALAPPGRMRLTHLHKRLPGISTGVLERGLQQMVAHGLVRRTRFKEMPPRVELELTDAGRELLPIAAALTRWGMRHLWSPPQEHEQVNLDVLLRLLPALLEEGTGLPGGSLEALVTETDPPVRYLYRVEDGRLRIEDRSQVGAVASAPAPSAANAAAIAATRLASVRGNTDAWIAALGPQRDSRQLRVAGYEPLASSILDALSGQRDQGLPQ